MVEERKDTDGLWMQAVSLGKLEGVMRSGESLVNG